MVEKGVVYQRGLCESGLKEERGGCLMDIYTQVSWLLVQAQVHRVYSLRRTYCSPQYHVESVSPPLAANTPSEKAGPLSTTASLHMSSPVRKRGMIFSSRLLNQLATFWGWNQCTGQRPSLTFSPAGLMLLEGVMCVASKALKRCCSFR